MKKLINQEISLNEEQYMQFVRFIDETLGLHFTGKDQKDVEKKLHLSALELGSLTNSEFVTLLTSYPPNQETIDVLAKNFTVGETYFFRDTNLFNFLETKIIPELVKAKEGSGKSIRIWCAACCTGEEAYSVAILLDRILSDHNDWNVLILGTDINPEFLKKAQQGIYKKWSFRATSDNVRNRYFKEIKEGVYQINPRIREKVRFAVLNLVEDKYPGLYNQTHSMDLILCNNVLIYFSQDKIDTTIHKLTASLVENGYLIVSALEVPFVKDEKLTPIYCNSVTSFRKESIPKLAIEFPLPSPSKKVAVLPPQPLKPPQTLKIKEDHDKKAVYFELFDKGNYDDLIHKLQKKMANAISKDDDVSLLVLLARAYANKGDPCNAKKALELVLKKDKLKPDLYFFYSTLLQELEMVPEAISALKRSLFLDPNYAISYYALGCLLLKTGKVKEADRNFRNAVHLLSQVDPNSNIVELRSVTVGALLEIISSIQKQTCCNK